MLQMHTYQSLRQDARGVSHSGGSHTGYGESLFGGVFSHLPYSPGHLSQHTIWLGANFSTVRLSRNMNLL